MIKRYLPWVMLLALLVVCGCGGSKPKKPSTTAANGKINWLTDYNAGLAQAKKENKPMMVEVSTTWCSACKWLEETVLSEKVVIDASRRFVPVRVDADKQVELKDKLKANQYPTIVFINPDGTEVERVIGAVPYQVMLESMNKVAPEQK